MYLHWINRVFDLLESLPTTNYMKEEYLHQIWLTKRLPMHQLTLTDGRKLEVFHTGLHNHDSGPDFFNGSIALDGIRWNGNIEIHIKSSDWYAHKHHLDEAYNNVILHVVYRHDKPVFINGEEIPTLELRSMLDKKHWSSYESLIKNNSWIPCEKRLATIDPFFIMMQLEDCKISRLHRKSEELDLRFQLLGRNLQQLQYEVLAQSFGTKVNALPFLELTQRMPVRMIWREGREVAPALLLGAAGFLQERQPLKRFGPFQRDWDFLRMKHRFETMNRLSWKFKGLRPSGFPDQRIVQFAKVVARMQQDFSFFEKSVAELRQFFRQTAQDGLSAAMQNLVLINSIAPLLWWYGTYRDDWSYRQKALDLLENLPPEKNEVIRSWEKLGVGACSAGDTQALLELKNEMCAQKKCLSCKIGHKVLGKL